MRLPLACPPLYGKQVEAVTGVLGPSADLEVHAFLGGMASGKSTAAAVAFLCACFENGWKPAYGKAQPRAMAVAPTSEILRDNVIYQIERMLPAELIAKRRKTPWSLTLINGLKITARSGVAAIEGIEVAVLWVEEVQHRNFWADPRKWPNYVARARDPHARKRRVIVSGHATSLIRPVFDRREVRLMLFGTRDNPAIGEDVIAGIRANSPAGMEDDYVEARWMSPDEGAFRMFDPAKHLVDDADDPLKIRIPVHAALDVGNFSHFLFFLKTQTRIKGVTGHPDTSPSLLVIDEISGRDQSIEDLCTRARIERRYELGESSTICVDPTVRRDELAVLRRHYPRARILQRRASDPLYYHEESLRLTQWGLLDGLGNVRIRFKRSLEKNTQGVLFAIHDAVVNPRTGELVRNNLSDHARDTLIYAACYVFEGCQRGPSMAALPGRS